MIEESADSAPQQPEQPKQYRQHSGKIDPKKLKAISALRLAGMGNNSAAKAVGIAPSTLSAYRKANPEWDRDMQGKLEQLADLTAERLYRTLADPDSKFKPEQLPIALGIVLDQRQHMLTNQAQAGTAQPLTGPSISTVLLEITRLCEGLPGPALDVPASVDQSVPVLTGQNLPRLAVPDSHLTGGGGSVQ